MKSVIHKKRPTKISVLDVTIKREKTVAVLHRGVQYIMALLASDQN